MEWRMKDLVKSSDEKHVIEKESKTETENPMNINPVETEEESCPDTGKPTYLCPCTECSPILVDFEHLTTATRNIEGMVDKLQDELEFYTHLLLGGFEIEPTKSREHFMVIPPLVAGSYWMRCDGCGYPVILEQGTDPEDILCEGCHKVMMSRIEGLNPRYYLDLFDFLGLILSPEGAERRLTVNLDGDLPFTKEFCETYGFDFDTIRVYLNRTGGYDDVEVLMNSMSQIPWFTKLPLRSNPLTDDEEEDE
jgi:hypothetical protein